MGEYKTRTATLADARAYIGKGRQFLENMEDALEAGRWDAASLDAVHAVISANDAVLAFREGIRCAEQDHRAAAALLREKLGSEAKDASKHVAFVIGRKNIVEYEQRRMPETEARQIAEHARRFLKWAETQLPPA